MLLKAIPNPLEMTATQCAPGKVTKVTAASLLSSVKLTLRIAPGTDGSSAGW